MQTNMSTLKEADWDKLESDVLQSIRMLRAIVFGADENGNPRLYDKIANDLILPNLALLSRFCENIQEQED